MSVGHSGIGSHTHISLAALFSAAGVEVNEVPFGAAQVVPSLLGGHVDAVVQLPAALSAPVKQGQVRLLAALIPNRDPALPGRADGARARRSTSRSKPGAASPCRTARRGP